MSINNNAYILTIIPLTDNTACLKGIEGQICNNGVFNHLGTYEGNNFYHSPESLKIDYGYIDGKQYIITEIQATAFSHCKLLKTLIIGKHVKSIQWNMYKCTSLINIFVEEGNETFSDINGVLFKGSELVGFPQGRHGSFTVPFGTTILGNFAFKSAQISQILLPNTLKKICENTFYECKFLNEIVLPESIESIDRNCDIGNRPIRQKFYLSNDTARTNPLNIEDVTKLFPV